MNENQGRRGPTGITGQTGQTGQPGAPGVQGTPGDIGETGPQGDKGRTGEAGSSPTADLLAAVRTLVDEVDKLSKRLSTNYPTKEEVQHEGRVRAFKTLIFGIVVIILANLFTIQTISYCFLNTPGTVHASCKYIPGYENAIVTGNARLAKFNLLLKQIKNNQESIIDLQKRVATLEKKTAGASR